MKKTIIFIFFILSTVSYSQIENQNRKIDIAPEKHTSEDGEKLAEAHVFNFPLDRKSVV